MNAFVRLYFRGWRHGVLAISVAIIAYLLYFRRLGTLLPGYNASEVTTFHDASNWHAIVANPVNAPYKVVVWLLSAVLGHGMLTTRIVSAVFGMLAVLLFYNIIRHWYSFRITFLTTLIFATSAGFLHNARLGNGLIMQMAVLAFVSATMWYRRLRDHRAIVGYSLAALFAALLYVPGMLWFELLAMVVLYRGFLAQVREQSYLHKAGWVVLFLAILAPLAHGIYGSPRTMLLSLSGLPGSVQQLSHFGINLLHTLLAIGIRSPGDPVLWIGHLPLLTIAGVVLVIIGIYDYVVNEQLSRVYFWIGCIVLSIILISFGGSVSYASLVPLLYLFIAAGLESLLGQWLRVFPRNPIARLVGTLLIAAMLFFSVMYQVRAYFVAWPHAKATQHAFNLPAPK